MGGFLRRVGATFGRTNVARITSILLTLQLALFPYASALAQSSVIATPLPNAKQTFVDQNGKPYSGGKVYNYVPNTSTPKTTWSDTGETTPNSNPVVLDSAGRGVIFGQGNYRQVLKDSAGNTIWDSFTTAVGSSDPSGSSSTDTAPVGAIMPWAGFSIPTNWLLAYGQTVNRADYPGLLTALTITNASTNCTAGSATLSGLADTSQMPIGAKIEASCLPTGTTISAKPSTTTLTVSVNATATGTFSSTVFPWGNGDGTLTFNLPDLRGRVFAGADAMGGTAANRLTSTYFGSSAASPAVAGGSQSHTLTAAESAALSYTANTSIPSSALAITGTQQFAALGGTTPNMALTGVANITAATTVSSNAGGQAHSIIQPTLTVNYIIKALPNTSGAGGVVSIGGMFGDITCGAFVTCENNTISLGSAPTATLNHGQIYVGDASNTPQGTFSPTLGIAGASAGSFGIASGTQVGVVSIKNPSATADYNFNLPANAGSANDVLTSGGGGSVPTAWRSFSNLYDSTFCNTVGYVVARLVSAWACSGDIPRNAVWFGADPTGVTSSSTARDAAYAACGTSCEIYFPAGTFLFTTPMVDTDNTKSVTWRGAGKFSTNITMPTATDITLFAVTASDRTFRDMTLIGSFNAGVYNPGSTRAGILLNNDSSATTAAHDFDIANMRFLHFLGYGVEVAGGVALATTSAASAPGSSTLTFALTPSWAVVGFKVADSDNPTAIQAGTTIVSTTATTVTLSLPVVDGGVGGVHSGDGIILAPSINGLGINRVRIRDSYFADNNKGGLSFFQGINGASVTDSYFYQNRACIGVDDATKSTAVTQSQANFQLLFSRNIYYQNGNGYVGPGEACVDVSAAQGLIVSDSLFYQTGHGPYNSQWSPGNTGNPIMYDVLINNGQDFYNQSQRVVLSNNVHWQSTCAAVYLQAPEDVKITNNIFWDWDTSPVDCGGANEAIFIIDDGNGEHASDVPFSTDGVGIHSNTFRLSGTVPTSHALTAVGLNSTTRNAVPTLAAQNIKVTGNQYPGGTIHFYNAGNAFFTSRTGSPRHIWLDDNPRMSRVLLANGAAAQIALSEFTTGVLRWNCSDPSYSAEDTFNINGGTPSNSTATERLGSVGSAGETMVATNASAPTGTTGTGGNVTATLVTGSGLLGQWWLENRSGAQISCVAELKGNN